MTALSPKPGGAHDGTAALIWLENGCQLRLDWFEDSASSNARFYRLRTWTQGWDGWHLDPNVRISSRELLGVLARLFFASLRARLRGILNPKRRAA
jgi:hypothetical protein